MWQRKINGYHVGLAVKEVLAISLLSTLPLWLGPWILPVVSVSGPLYVENSGYLDKLSAVYLNIGQSGDLALYASSFLASIIFLAGSNYKERDFPGRLFFIVLAFVLMFCSGSVYLANSIASETDPDLTPFLSLGVFLISGLFWFLAILNKNAIVNPVEAMSDVENSFVFGYKSRMGGRRG